MRGKQPKGESQSGVLKGWKDIARYLGIPVTTAQRWAKTGMPTDRQGRFTVANVEDLSKWLGRESHMRAPAQIVTPGADLAVALKKSIVSARHLKKR